MGAEKPKRLYQEIGNQLRQQIASEGYRIGDKLPPEREIAEQLGVSRAVIREALIMLELQELVEVRKGSGVYITRLPDAVVADVAAPAAQADAPLQDDAGPFEMLQARQLLESRIAEFAASQVTKKDIAQLRQLLDKQRQQLVEDVVDEEVDKQFHLAIAEATQNCVLTDVVHEMWSRRQASPMWRKLHSRISDQTYRQGWIEDHETILAALQRRDPAGARKAMWDHLESVKQTLLELSDVDDPNFDGYLFSSSPAA